MGECQKAYEPMKAAQQSAMTPELEALRKQYLERSDKQQCVCCGEPLIEGYEVRTVTDWLRCDRCGSFYDPVGHRTYLGLELHKKAREIGVMSEDLSDEDVQEVLWQCEGW